MPIDTGKIGRGLNFGSESNDSSDFELELEFEFEFEFVPLVGAVGWSLELAVGSPSSEELPLSESEPAKLEGALSSPSLFFVSAVSLLAAPSAAAAD